MKSLSRVDTVTYCLFCKMPYEQARLDYSDRVFCRTCLERAMLKAEIMTVDGSRMSDLAHYAIEIYDKKRAKNGNR